MNASDPLHPSTTRLAAPYYVRGAVLLIRSTWVGCPDLEQLSPAFHAVDWLSSAHFGGTKAKVPGTTLASCHCCSCLQAGHTRMRHQCSDNTAWQHHSTSILSWVCATLAVLEQLQQLTLWVRLW